MVTLMNPTALPSTCGRGERVGKGGERKERGWGKGGEREERERREGGRGEDRWEGEFYKRVKLGS